MDKINYKLINYYNIQKQINNTYQKGQRIVLYKYD